MNRLLKKGLCTYVINQSGDRLAKMTSTTIRQCDGDGDTEAIDAFVRIRDLKEDKEDVYFRRGGTRTRRNDGLLYLIKTYNIHTT